MSEIRSNADDAQAIASAIEDSLNTLSGGVAITTDSHTTVAGNSTAHDLINQLKEFNTSLVEAVEQATMDIQSVASEFTAVDQGISESISQ